MSKNSPEHDIYLHKLCLPELKPLFSIRFLYDGDVWALLCNLSFGDDISHNSGWKHDDFNATPRCARPACQPLDCQDSSVVVSMQVWSGPVRWDS